MTTQPRRAARRAVASAFTAAILVAGCGPAADARPTDPGAIAASAVAATAALSTLRLHVEMVTTGGGAGNQPNGRTTLALDVDLDLPTRQLAGTSTMQMAPLVGVNNGPLKQVQDVIVTNAATFSRDSGTGRWMKFPDNPGGGGPSNAEIVGVIAKLIADPTTTYELAEAGPCTLGTCDHVTAHVSGAKLGAALVQLAGGPLDQSVGGVAALPDVDLDLLVDQASSVLSEVRTGVTMQGTTVQVLLAISNPGQPIQIIAPAPGLTDDFGANVGGGFGGFGGGTTTIIDTVGNEVPPDPTSAIESPAP